MRGKTRTKKRQISKLLLTLFYWRKDHKATRSKYQNTKRPKDQEKDIERQRDRETQIERFRDREIERQRFTLVIENILITLEYSL
jgi:hypothetical protein